MLFNRAQTTTPGRNGGDNDEVDGVDDEAPWEDMLRRPMLS